MKPNDLTPEQLAEQLVANSTALIGADLKLRATSQAAGQRSDELQRQVQKSQAASKREGRIFWLLIAASAAILSYSCYLSYPF